MERKALVNQDYRELLFRVQRRQTLDTIPRCKLCRNVLLSEEHGLGFCRHCGEPDEE